VGSKKSQISKFQFQNKSQLLRPQFPKELEDVGFILMSYEPDWHMESLRGPKRNRGEINIGSKSKNFLKSDITSNSKLKKV
jgi:hypothetical protein